MDVQEDLFHPVAAGQASVKKLVCDAGWFRSSTVQVEQKWYVNAFFYLKLELSD